MIDPGSFAPHEADAGDMMYAVPVVGYIRRYGVGDFLDIQAVIFDLDGLIVDTEPFGLQAWQQCLDPCGVQLQQAHYQQLIGLGQQETAAYLLELSGASWTPAELLDTFWQCLHTILEAVDLQPRPGLNEVLAVLGNAQLPLGVASNSPTSYVEHVLERLDLLHVFDVVLGNDGDRRAKPAPDIFLEAARRLGVEPEACLVFEDSPGGREAALAAGMRCFYVPNRGLRSSMDANGEVDTFPSLHDSLGLVRELVNGRKPEHPV